MYGFLYKFTKLFVLSFAVICVEMILYYEIIPSKNVEWDNNSKLPESLVDTRLERTLSSNSVPSSTLVISHGDKHAVRFAD